MAREPARSGAPKNWGKPTPFFAYMADCLLWEVATEGLVRKLAAFSDFLDGAALCDGKPVN